MLSQAQVKYPARHLRAWVSSVNEHCRTRVPVRCDKRKGKMRTHRSPHLYTSLTCQLPFKDLCKLFKPRGPKLSHKLPQNNVYLCISLCVGLIENLNLLFNLPTFFGLLCLYQIWATWKKRTNSQNNFIPRVSLQTSH